MKRTIILCVIISALIAAVSIAGKLAIKWKKESLRNALNYEIVAGQKMSLQQQLTVSELKAYYPKIVEVAKDNKIKPRNITDVVQTKYRYIDSTRLRDTLVWIYDTIQHHLKSDFRFTDNHFIFSGSIHIFDSLEVIDIVNREFVDKITTILFRYRPNVFKKWMYKAISISEYNGDTLSIENNIHVVKGKKRR